MPLRGAPPQRVVGGPGAARPGSGHKSGRLPSTSGHSYSSQGFARPLGWFWMREGNVGAGIRQGLAVSFAAALLVVQAPPFLAARSAAASGVALEPATLSLGRSAAGVTSFEPAPLPNAGPGFEQSSGAREAGSRGYDARVAFVPDMGSGAPFSAGMRPGANWSGLPPGVSASAAAPPSFYVSATQNVLVEADGAAPQSQETNTGTLQQAQLLTALGPIDAHGSAAAHAELVANVALGRLGAATDMSATSPGAPSSGHARGFSRSEWADTLTVTSSTLATGTPVTLVAHLRLTDTIVYVGQRTCPNAHAAFAAGDAVAEVFWAGGGPHNQDKHRSPPARRGPTH